MTSPRTCFCLIERVGSEQTENDRYIVCKVQLGSSLRYAFAHKCKVRGLALDNTSKDNDAVHVCPFDQDFSPVRQFETSRDVLNNYILLLHAKLDERVVCALKQFAGDGRVPVGNHDAYSFPFARRNGRGIV